MKISIIAIMMAFCLGSLAKKLPEWYVDDLDSGFLPILVEDGTDGDRLKYSIKSHNKGKISVQNYDCRLGQNGNGQLLERNSNEGMFFESQGSLYTLKYCKEYVKTYSSDRDPAPACFRVGNRTMCP